MISRRTSVVPVILVLFCAPELSWGQFQRLFMQPGRGRFPMATGRMDMMASCLDYGVKKPAPGDVFASVNEGYGFLVGGLPGGREERLDLSLAIRTGQVVLRGTGRDDQIRMEVLTPGWSEYEILPGLQALPPGMVAVEIPKTTLDLVQKSATARDDLKKLPTDAGSVVDSVLAGARQEHLWTLRSPSWQTLESGADPLQTAVDRVGKLSGDATVPARLEWILRSAAGAQARESKLAFLGDAIVLRLREASDRGSSSLEVCTREGVKSVPITRAGLRALKDSLPDRSAVDVIITNELFKALDRAGVTTVFEDGLAAAGHTTACLVQDDCLLVQSFEAQPAVRRRFAVIAPQMLAEAKALLGRNAREGFAFKGLIGEKRVEVVKTAADLQRLAAGAHDGEQLVLVCMQQHGQIPLVDGSRLPFADLPPGVAEVIACDAFDPAERPPLEAMQPGAFTLDALAAGIRAAITVGDVGPLTRTELLQSLSTGFQDYWKHQKAGTRPIVKWTQMGNGNVVSVGAKGTVLKVDIISPRKERAGKTSA